MRGSFSCFSAVDVYESSTSFVLVGHDGSRRRMLHVHRHPADAPPQAVTESGALPGGSLPPVTEDRRSYSQAACEKRLAELGSDDDPLVRVIRGAAALLGMVRFLEGWYMLFVTRTEIAGIIGGHAIHRVEETAMLSVSSPATSASAPSASIPEEGDSAGDGAGTADASRSGGGGGKSASRPRAGSSNSFFKGSKASGWRIFQAAAAGLATKLQLTGWAESWAETKCA